MCIRDRAYLGEMVDMNQSNKVRPQFARLASIAERTGCSIILIGHLNKKEGTKDLYRALGSIDIAAAVRSVLLVTEAIENKGRKVLLQLKNNLAPMCPGIEFELGEAVDVYKRQQLNNGHLFNFIFVFVEN